MRDGCTITVAKATHKIVQVNGAITLQQTTQTITVN